MIIERKKFLRFFCCMLLLMCMTATGVSAAQDARVRTLRIEEGDSISYLCFLRYGIYFPEMAEVLKVYNPFIENVNVIHPGQWVRFPPEKEMQEFLIRKGLISRENIVGYITYSYGPISVKKTAEDGWKPGSVNQSIGQGDGIRVGEEARVEIILDSGDTVRVGSNSEIRMKVLSRDPAEESRIIQILLTAGKMWNRVKGMVKPDSRYIIRTPTAIASVRGTDFSVQIIDGTATEISVYEGEIGVENISPKEKTREVEAQKRAVTLNRQQRAVFTGEKVEGWQHFDPDQGDMDAWTNWNLHRNKRLKYREEKTWRTVPVIKKNLSD